MGAPVAKQEFDSNLVRQRLGKGVPDSVVNLIVKSKDPKKLEDVAAAVAKIRKHAQEHKEYAVNFTGWEFALKVLRNEKIAKAFVDKPEQISSALMKMAEYVREGARGNSADGGAFEALEKTEMGDAFVKDPKAVLAAFRRISDSIGEPSKIPKEFMLPEEKAAAARAAERRVEAFSNIANPSIAKVFAKHIDAVVEMCAYAGEASPAILGALTQFGPMLEKNKRLLLDSFKSIKRSSGGDDFRFRDRVTNTFEELAQISGLFVRYPSEFVEISKSAGHLAGYVFKAFQDPRPDKGIVRLFLQNPRAVADAFGKIKEYAKEAFPLFAPFEFAGRIVSPYEFIELAVRYIDHYPKAQKLASSLGIPKSSVEVCANFAYAISTIGEEKTKLLNRRFGIEYFGRYSKAQLEDMGNKVANGKPVLLAVFSKDDPPGAFYRVGGQLESLMKYYNVVIVEVNSDTEVYSRIREMSGAYGKIDTMLIAGHGSPEKIMLGKPPSGPARDEDTLDLMDGSKLASVRQYFVDKPTVILESCSTGKDEKSIGALLSRIWGARLFAPTVPSSESKYELEKDGKIKNVTYDVESREFQRGAVPKKIR
jgi:hypothetical protein